MRSVSDNPPSPYAATAPQSLSADALRREAVTIPADTRAQSVSQPPPYDPSHPLPSLRVPSFAPQSFGPDPIRHQENRRLGSVAFVLLVGLLIVTGAIMGVNYAAKGNREEATTATLSPTETTAPKVKLERLSPNAVVAPPALSQTLESTQRADENTTSVGIARTPQTNGSTVRSNDPSNLASPWSRTAKTTSKSRANQPKSATSTQGARKRLDPKSIDTETPLIMD